MAVEDADKFAGTAPEAAERGRTQKKEVSVIRRLGPPILAPIAMALSLAGVVGLFKFWLPPMGEAALQVQAEAAAAPEAAPVVENTYMGVEDPWLMSGYFTVGDGDLDAQIKKFCDAFSGESRTSQEAAQTLYNNIVWGNYTAREDGSKPFGRDWVIVSARIYFDSADPDAGQIGDGDYYEWAAALAFCMRYFGYSDAIAVPTISYDDWGNAEYSAITYLTGEGGKRYLLDPALGASGWMIDASTRDILVDNIGQDISVAESYGLKVVKNDEEVTEEGVQEQDGTLEGDEAEQTPVSENTEMGEYDQGTEDGYVDGYGNYYGDYSDEQYQ